MQKHEIEAAVRAITAPHMDAWRKQIHEGFVENAEHQKERFKSYWSTVKPGEKIPHSYDRPRLGERNIPPPSGLLKHPRYVDGARELHVERGDEVHAAKNNTVEVNHDHVKKLADATFDDLHAAFVTRAVEKIGHIAGARKVSSVGGALRMGRGVEGAITAHLGDLHNHFTLDASVQTNYRYGENAADRNLTTYHQYPFRVMSAHVNGAKVPAPSADDLATTWGGIPHHQAERNRIETNKSTKAAWTSKRDELESHVDAWKDVHGAVTGHAKDSENAASVRDPAHPKHAKMKREYDQSVERTFQMNPHLRGDEKFKANITPFPDTYPTPSPLPDLSKPAPPPPAPGKRDRRHGVHRLGLTAWPSAEEAKGKLAQARAALAAHKETKP